MSSTAKRRGQGRFHFASDAAPCAQARVAKLVYAWDLKSPGRKAMWVRPPPRAPAYEGVCRCLALAATALHACVLLAVSIAGVAFNPGWLWPAVVFFRALFLLGVADLLQQSQNAAPQLPDHRPFPLFPGSIGPEIRQYFIESDTGRDAVLAPAALDRLPAREERARQAALRHPARRVRQRLRVDQPFARADRYRRRMTSASPIGADARKPYSASVFNISAMSFGSLSANAIRALNEGARRGGFYHDTGEGSISQYHRENGGDLVWEIGRAISVAGTRTARFNEERFVDNASAAGEDDRDEAVAGRQAGPRRRTARRPRCRRRFRAGARRARWAWIACRRRGIRHSRRRSGCWSSSTRLRKLSGGKPTGFKLAIGHPWEWFAIAKAMQETGLLPDFIVVDGGEGGTGAAPLEFTDHVGAPLREALLLVHNTLVGLNLRGQHPHRRGGQDRHRLRHRAHDGAGRRLVQRGARLHVRARLHPVA